MSFASTSVANITISNIYYLSYYIVAKNSTADICLVNVMAYALLSTDIALFGS